MVGRVLLEHLFIPESEMCAKVCDSSIALLRRCVWLGVNLLEAEENHIVLFSISFCTCGLMALNFKPSQQSTTASANLDS